MSLVLFFQKPVLIRNQIFMIFHWPVCYMFFWLSWIHIWVIYVGIIYQWFWSLIWRNIFKMMFYRSCAARTKMFFAPLMRKNRRLVDFLRSCSNSYHLRIRDERMIISNRRSKLGEVLHWLEWSDLPQSKTVTISFHPQDRYTASDYSYSIGCMSFSKPKFSYGWIIN